LTGKPVSLAAGSQLPAAQTNPAGLLPVGSTQRTNLSVVIPAKRR